MSDTSNIFFLAALLPMLLIIGINVVFGIIALNMANKRGLRTVPAFFAGLFGSFVALFFIAMFPVQS
ncbi:MAG: hypothetical protein ACYDG2_19945 [Ruminiclostridium sp.]